MLMSLQQFQKEEVALIRNIRKGEVEPIPELVTAVCNFDHFYFYTDNLHTYNSQEARHKELTQQIKELDEDVLKNALFSALSGKLGEVDKLYPHRTYMRYKNSDPVDEKAFELNDITSTETYTLKKFLLAIGNVLHDEYETQPPVLGSDFGILYTPSAPPPKTLQGKRSVRESVQKVITEHTSVKYIQDLFKKMPKELNKIFLTTEVVLLSYSRNYDDSHRFTLLRDRKTITFTLFI